MKLPIRPASGKHNVTAIGNRRLCWLAGCGYWFRLCSMGLGFGMGWDSSASSHHNHILWPYETHPQFHRFPSRKTFLQKNTVILIPFKIRGMISDWPTRKLQSQLSSAPSPLGTILSRRRFAGLELTVASDVSKQIAVVYGVLYALGESLHLQLT